MPDINGLETKGAATEIEFCDLTSVAGPLKFVSRIVKASSVPGNLLKKLVFEVRVHGNLREIGKSRRVENYGARKPFDFSDL